MKFLCVLLLPLFFLSCGKSEYTFPEDFDSEIVIQTGQKSYTAAFTREDGEKRLLFSSPQSINGLSAVLSEDGSAEISFGELEFVSRPLGKIFDFAALFETGSITLGGDGVPVEIFGVAEGREYKIQILKINERAEND